MLTRLLWSLWTFFLQQDYDNRNGNAALPHKDD